MLRHLANEDDQLQEHYNKLWDEYEENKNRWENEINDLVALLNNCLNKLKQMKQDLKK